MKRNFKIILISVFLVIAPLLMFAQEPPPPGGTDGKTTVGGTQAGAPIGNGTFILLTLAAAYAIGKVYVMRSAKEEVTE